MQKTRTKIIDKDQIRYDYSKTLEAKMIHFVSESCNKNVTDHANLEQNFISYNLQPILQVKYLIRWWFDGC